MSGKTQIQVALQKSYDRILFGKESPVLEHPDYKSGGSVPAQPGSTPTE